MTDEYETREPGAWVGLVQAEFEMVIGRVGQLKSIEALRRILRAIDEIPEDQVVLGVVFGLTIAPKPEFSASGVKLTADCVVVRWGLRQAVAMAASEAERLETQG